MTHPFLLCHGDSAEPTKHVAVRRRPYERDVRLALDLVEQPFVIELVNGVVGDDCSTCLRCPVFERALYIW